jgi:hypothetical protein
MTPQEAQPAEKRTILPLAYDVERLVATLMSPNASLNRRLAAAERLYSLMPSYIWRSIREAATKLVGKEALIADKTDKEKVKDYDARRELLVSVLKGLLKAMEETRQKIVEVKLPPIPSSEELFKGDLSQIADEVTKALTNWFYSATEEARKKEKPYNEDPNAPGYVPLITFASLVLVNGLRQLTTLVGE